MDFSLERIRTLEPDSDDEQYLLEISWLYNRIVVQRWALFCDDISFLVIPERILPTCGPHGLRHFH